MTWLNQPGTALLPALSKGSLQDSAPQQQVLPCESPGAVAAEQEGGTHTPAHTHYCKGKREQKQECLQCEEVRKDHRHNSFQW